MVVPTTGSLSLAAIGNEKNQDDYTSDDGEMIDFGDISLRGLSNNSFNDGGIGNINLNTDFDETAAGGANLDDAPYAMSEFRGYDHDYVSVIHSTAITTGNTGGYGFAQSGYFQGSYGSITSDLFTLNSVSNQRITGFYSNSTSTTATTGIVNFRVVDSGGNDSSNAGWTVLYVYMNQSNNSGSPDHTFSRTNAASFTGNSGTKTWTFNVSNSNSPYVYGTYFGGSTNTNIFLEIL